MTEPKTTAAPPRRCACVSHDPFECIRVRYRSFDDDLDDYSEREQCECICHEEWKEEEYD
jgi:hypothetical protein